MFLRIAPGITCGIKGDTHMHNTLIPRLKIHVLVSISTISRLKFTMKVSNIMTENSSVHAYGIEELIMYLY